MRTPLTPHTLRRNRLLLAGCVLFAAGYSVWAADLFTGGTAGAPLLLSMDELHVPPSKFDVRPIELRSMRTIHRAHTSPSAALTANATAAESEPEILLLQEQGNPDLRWFNGRPVRPVRTMVMLTTAYSPDERSCGDSADGITASGYSVWTNGMRLAAADTSVLPFGSMISVPGYDEGGIIPVLDRGGAIQGNRLDLLYGSHEEALQWGVQSLEVTVWEYADGLPNDYEPRYQRASSVQ